MNEQERIELIRLLKLRKNELKTELAENDYSAIPSVIFSKERQIDYIAELTLQLSGYLQD